MSSRTYQEAAAELNVSWHWLRRRIDTLPHHKYGHLVRFEDEDMAAIKPMFAKQPKSEAEPRGATLTLLREQANQRQIERITRSAAAPKKTTRKKAA